MRILLLRPQGRSFTSCLHPRNLRPPYMLKYMETCLADQGIESVLHDEYICGSVKSSIDFSTVVICCITPDRNRAMNLISHYREQNIGINIIACGQDATDFPDLYYLSGVDHVLMGEAEFAACQLIPILELPHNKRSSSIKQSLCAESAIVNELDSLPLPSYSRWEIESYRFFYPVPTSEKLCYGHILTSRGCTWNCLFCTQVHRESFGKKMRYHSVSRITEEIKRLKHKGVNFILFDDDNFLHNRELSIELFNSLKKNGLNLPWQCHTRPENLDKEFISFLGEFNCKLLRLGVESGSEKVLERIKKTSDPERFLAHCHNAIKWARMSQVPTLMLIMIGCPRETIRQILKTLVTAIRMNPDMIQVSFYTDYNNEEQAKSSSLGEAYHYSQKKASSAIHPFLLKLLQSSIYISFYMRPWKFGPLFWKYRGFIKKNISDILVLLKIIPNIFQFR